MILGEIRQAVRDQVDQDETDLPNARLDNYIREGYGRLIQLETRWPFFETTWTEPIVGEAQSFTLPTTVAEVSAIRTDTTRLTMIDHRDGEDYFGFDPSPSTIAYWSKIGRTVHLWPPPSASLDLVIRGFRHPTDWVTAGAGAEVDADERLHWPIVNYALAKVYAQQEDEVLKNEYLSDFREGVAVARAAVMRPWKNESFTLGDGRLRPWNRQRPFWSYIAV